ncbi:MAG: hypothetical protein UZ01_03468 [Candidatus Brocadia sinica]|nr:MAG: hypothetical protein UZ01_03468 [Candidatus Brocadia sinica]
MFCNPLLYPPPIALPVKLIDLNHYQSTPKRFLPLKTYHFFGVFWQILGCQYPFVLDCVQTGKDADNKDDPQIVISLCNF